MCHALQEVMCITTNLLLGGTLHVALSAGLYLWLEAVTLQLEARLG